MHGTPGRWWLLLVIFRSRFRIALLIAAGPPGKAPKLLRSVPRATIRTGGANAVAPGQIRAPRAPADTALDADASGTTARRDNREHGTRFPFGRDRHEGGIHVGGAIDLIPFDLKSGREFAPILASYRADRRVGRAC